MTEIYHRAEIVEDPSGDDVPAEVPEDNERALWVAAVAFGEDRRRRVPSDVPQRASLLVGGDTCVPFWRVRAK